MKKFWMVLVLGWISYAAQSQDTYYAKLFSQNQTVGSARVQGMGGAYGAVGADISAGAINPAGLGLFRRSELSASVGLNNFTNMGKYAGENTETRFSKLDFGNIGFLSHSETSSEDWSTINYAIAYNKQASFENTFRIKGYNATSNLVDYYAYLAQGLDHISLEKNLTYSALAELAWNSAVIDSVPNNNTQYFAVTDAGGLNEVLNCTTHGGIGEYNFAISTDYQHKLYLGLSVGFRTLSYERRWEFNEVDSKNIQSKLDKASYTANQLTEGNGVNIKVGAIYRLLDFVRLGLAYESPTYYGMKYNLIHSLSSNFKNGELWDATQSTDFTYDYKTPSRLTLSLAAQYKSNLMFSVDADFVNYQNTNFFSNDYGYENENQDLTKELHRTMNLRAGVEFKQGILALRAGYAHQGNPYSDKVSVDATRRTFTLGAGVRSAAFFADIAYTHATTASQEFFVEKYENFNPILDLTQNSAVISLGFFF